MSTNRKIESLVHRIERLEGVLDEVLHILRKLLDRRHHAEEPAAGQLSGTFTARGDCMSLVVLTLVLPTTREDGSLLAVTDIASVTFQKVPSGSAAGTAPTVLHTGTPDTLTYSDSTAAAGDSYTAFVTDTQGNAGAETAPYVAVGSIVTPPPTLSPPAAGTLSGTFTP